MGDKHTKMPWSLLELLVVNIWSLYLENNFNLLGQFFRFLQEKSIASTGQPEYYSCQGVCTHSSLPCFSSLNSSLQCLTGYWLCEDMAQCVLLGKLSVEDNHYSSLCDGKIDCKDGSDEGSYQCLQVA